MSIWLMLVPPPAWLRKPSGSRVAILAVTLPWSKGESIAVVGIAGRGRGGHIAGELC